jgi:peroxiredoxin
MTEPVTINLPAPDFSLPDLSGALHRLSDLRGQVVVLEFWSAECGWCRRADEQLREWLPAWGEQVVMWAVAANPHETPEEMAEAAERYGVPLVLLDPGQAVTRMYGAKATPHFFVIDAGGLLRYSGAFDDVTFRQRTPTHTYLKDAVEAVLRGEAPNPAQTPAYGCAIAVEED